MVVLFLSSLLLPLHPSKDLPVPARITQRRERYPCSLLHRREPRLELIDPLSLVASHERLDARPSEVRSRDIVPVLLHLGILRCGGDEGRARRDGRAADGTVGVEEVDLRLIGEAGRWPRVLGHSTV